MKTDKFVEIVKARSMPVSLIFDIGSFDAEQAVELANAFPSADVLALEADPYNMPKCLGKGYPQVNVVNAALALFDGVVRFHRAIGQNDQCGSLLRPNNRYPQAMPTESILVPALRSQTLMSRVGVPDLLWMDVQGTEWDFFSETDARPKAVWLEVAYQAYYNDQPLKADLESKMWSIGYRSVYEAEGIAGWFGDVCFIHESVP